MIYSIRGELVHDGYEKPYKKVLAKRIGDREAEEICVC